MRYLWHLYESMSLQEVVVFVYPAGGGGEGLAVIGRMD